MYFDDKALVVGHHVTEDHKAIFVVVNSKLHVWLYAEVCSYRVQNVLVWGAAVPSYWPWLRVTLHVKSDTLF